jgi:hypothetical protein
MNLLPVLWFKVGDQDKLCAPRVCSTRCSSKLNANRKECSTPFAVLMLWLEPTDHFTELLLYVATYSARDNEDEKMVSGVPKYTIDNSSSDSL